MRRDGEPFAVLARPHIGVAAGARASVGQRVTGAGVDDRDIAEYADLDIMRCQIRDRDRPRGLREKATTVQQRSVRVGAAEIRCENLVEWTEIAVLAREEASAA